MALMDRLRGSPIEQAYAQGVDGDEPRRGLRGVQASGRRIDLADRDQIKRIRDREEWQRDAWTFFDTLGEVKYGATFKGQALSRVRIFAAELDDADGPPQPTDNDAAMDAVERLGGTSGDHAELLRRAAINWTIAGEGYLVGRSIDDGEAEEWSFRSVEEIEKKSGDKVILKSHPNDTTGIELRDGDDDDTIPSDSDSDFLARVWLPHGRFSEQADAPLRGVLSSCEELLKIEQAVRASMRSRLPSGLVFLPDTMETFAQPADPTQSEQDGEARGLVAELGEAMTIPVQDEGHPAALVPFMVRGPAEEGEKIRHITFERTLDDSIEQRTERALRRLAQGIDLPPEILTGMADLNHWPMTEWTEVYTRRGWLTWDQLVPGEDEAWTVDHATGTGSWLTIEDVPHQHVEDYPMVQVDRALVKATSTPDHRWPVVRDGRRIWTTAAGLRPDDRIIGAVPAAQLPQSPKYSDDFVALMAWYSADGSLTGGQYGRGQIRIAKSWRENPDKVARLRTHLEAVFGPAQEAMPYGSPPGFRIEHQARGMEVFVLNAAARDVVLEIVPDADKVIPTSFVDQLTPAQLEAFIAAWLESDGDGRTVTQSDPDRLAAVEYAAILCGYNVSWRRREETDRHGAFGDGPMHILRISAAPRAAHPMVGPTKTISYTGEIFCLRTPPNASWFARDQGRTFYTGNTAWQIERATWKVHLEPILGQLLSAFTRVFLWPHLRAAGVDEPERFLIWYDPSPLLAPNPTASDAFRAYENFAISGASLRDRTGFSEEDAPDDEELEQRIRIKVANVLTQVTGQPPEADVTTEGPPPQEEPPEPSPPEGESLTAAAVSDLGERLADIDRTLAERLAGAADQAMRRVLERAGANLRSRAGRNRALSDAINGVDNTMVAAHLGRDGIAQLNVDVRDIVADGFDPFGERFRRWVDQASDSALEEVAESTVVDPQVAREAREALEEDRDEAWTWFRDALVGAAVSQLFDPRPGRPDGESGEFEPDSRVAFGTIREAMARAGGAARSPVGLIKDAGISLRARGVATGVNLLDMLSSLGIAERGLRWDYRPAIPRDNFNPHRALHNRVFSGTDDDALTVTTGFPQRSHYHPGDHRGCRCTWVPQLIQREQR